MPLDPDAFSYTFMTTNPSHILIARHSRGPNNPSASLSSPTETHAAAAGIFRSSGSPPWLLDEGETDDVVSELSIDDDEKTIEIDDAFTKHSRFPGTVKIIVESTTFWCVGLIILYERGGIIRAPKLSLVRDPQRLTRLGLLSGRTRRCSSSHPRSSKPRSAVTGPKPTQVVRSPCRLSSPFLNRPPFPATRA